VAELVETGASGAITTLAKADGYVEIPENQQFVDKDEAVEVSLFKKG
jgi:molybdopterin biosynthesis enzyme